jgi:hypothetical protein
LEEEEVIWTDTMEGSLGLHSWAAREHGLGWW